MPQQTMFSVYGSGHVGFFGGTIQATNVPEILQIDCDATDFYKKDGAYPTCLLFNPYQETKTVTFNAGPKRVDLYDSVSRKFVQRGVRGNIQLSIPADGARVLVSIPAGTRVSVRGKVLMAGKVPVDYRYGG
jgi:hypothetical protein